MTANSAERLLRYYVDNFRRLPWRSAPGSAAADPYRVWLSEVMLQQTTVTTVISRFERFVTRWPNVKALAAASDSEVMQEWAGLGYYARARNLIACARQVAAAGGFPKSAVELRKLPGLGDYTAAAIAAIAFGEQTAPVDTNVERVLARLNAIAEPERKSIERLFLELCPPGRAGDFAQALMDLGSAICRPARPRCGECPLATGCAAFASGTPEAFPQPRQRAVRPKRFGTAWWIEEGGSVWLVRRPARGLLGGMAALPGSDWTEAPVSSRKPIGQVRHVFTHFALELAIERRDEPSGEGWWQPLDRLGEAGLPTLYKRAAALVMDARADAAAAA